MAVSSLTDRYEAALAAVTSILDATSIDLYDKEACERLEHLRDPARSIIVTGPYALDHLVLPRESVHVVCVSSNSRATFWSLFHENFQLSDQVSLVKAKVDGVIELSSLDVSLNNGEHGACLRELARLRRLNQLGIRTHLHFCQLPQGHHMWHLATGRIDASSLDEYDSLGLILAMKAQELASAEVMRTPAHRVLFRKVYKHLYLWCTEHGLIGPEYGFLEGDMLLEVTLLLLPNSPPVDFDDQKQCLLAFERFKKLIEESCSPQIRESVQPATQCSDISIRKLFARELTPEARAAIITSTALEDVALSDEFSPQRAAQNQHRMPYEDYLLVECESWTTSLNDRAAFQETDVPRNLNNLVETFRDQTHGTEVHHFGIGSLRIWPEPFFLCPEQNEQLLVIGIERQRNDTEANKQFVERVHELSNYIEENILDYDRTIGLMTFKHIRRKELEIYLSQTATRRHDTTTTTTSYRSAPESNDAAKNNRFRTAHSAMNRLQHDPKHCNRDYLIGYQDRFSSELAWMPLKLWVGKQIEDDDFIPQHRVRQITLVDEEPAVVVWDREKRVDRI